MSPKPMTVLKVKVKPKTKLLEVEMKAEADMTWEGGRGENNPIQWVAFSRLAEMSITVFVQTIAASLALQFSGDRSFILISVVLCNLADYICCMSAIALRSRGPRIARILERIGSVAAAFGFIQMLAMFLSDYHQ